MSRIGQTDDGAFTVEVIADDSGKWCGNDLRFDTQDHAVDYAYDLASRWMLVREWRVMERTDSGPVECVRHTY